MIKAVNNTSDQAIELSDESLKKIQRVLLSILDDVLDVCSMSNIKCQMSGGSALGAIRHHGFIPWDDDIDLNMYREDIDKFLYEFQKKYGDKYWLHIPGKTENYDFLTIKIVSKKVWARELLDSSYNGECGFAIDIFVIENQPNNKLLRKLFQFRCMFGRYILSCLRFKNSEQDLLKMSKDDNELLKVIRRRSFMGKIFSKNSVKTWVQQVEKWCSVCKNNHSKYVGIVSGRKQINKETYLRSDFDPIEAEFEGRKVYVARNYKGYMEKLFGTNYMQIPPLEKREKHVLMELDKEALDNIK